MFLKKKKRPARNSCCWDYWVCRSRINFWNLQRFAVPDSLWVLRLQVVDIPNLLRTWTGEDPTSWKKTSCMLPDECGVLEIWLVASMGFVGDSEIVHHGHEDDAVACACLAYLFHQNRPSGKRAVHRIQQRDRGLAWNSQPMNFEFLPRWPFRHMIFPTRRKLSFSLRTSRAFPSRTMRRRTRALWPDVFSGRRSRLHFRISTVLFGVARILILEQTIPLCD